MTPNASNIIGVCVFALALSLLYVWPVLSLRRDRRFWRVLRALDPLSPTGKESERTKGTPSHGLLEVERSQDPPGLDSYGRAPCMPIKTGASLHPWRVRPCEQRLAASWPSAGRCSERQRPGGNLAMGLLNAQHVKLVNGDGEDVLTARERGVGFVRHFAGLMLDRDGDLHLAVHKLDRKTFDALPGDEIPVGALEKPYWFKRFEFPASVYGGTMIDFFTHEAP